MPAAEPPPNLAGAVVMTTSGGCSGKIFAEIAPENALSVTASVIS
jgi:hypothetical protein